MGDLYSFQRTVILFVRAPHVGVFACKDNKGMLQALLCTTLSVNCFRCISVTRALGVPQ